MTIEAPESTAMQALRNWRDHAARAEALLDARPNTRGKVEVGNRKYTVAEAMAAAAVEATLAQAAALMAQTTWMMDGGAGRDQGRW